MKQAVMVAAAGLALLASPARAGVTFDFIFDGGYPLSASYDGSVVAGNLTNYGPFRWTQATGPASLGRVPHQGAAGSPGISADGTKVASTIASPDSSYTTQGLWTLGSGWQELMPPTPPDGGIQDGSYGSVWGLSGDGETAVGLYRRSGGRAHASKWTQATGVVDLGGTINMQASRANGVNFDGSVIVGWVETPTGPWRPAAWDNGSLVLLSNYTGVTSVAGSGQAQAVTPSGDIIVGYMSDSLSHQRAATMWKRANGSFGPPQVLGWVDGTTPEYGINVANGVSSNGRIVVGYCSYDGDPFYTTGFVWTQETGVVDVNAYLADHGVFVDPNFGIQSMNAITPDGTQLFGFGKMLTPPYTTRAFRITVTPAMVGVTPAGPLARLELSAPVPNPSASAMRLDFSLAAASSADLTIFDAAGRRVTTLVNGELTPGPHSITWDGREESGSRARAGIYFARLTTAQGAASRRLVRVE